MFWTRSRPAWLMSPRPACNAPPKLARVIPEAGGATSSGIRLLRGPEADVATRLVHTAGAVVGHGAETHPGVALPLDVGDGHKSPPALGGDRGHPPHFRLPFCRQLGLGHV